ncbi:tumor necrosis factor receptor superfamily member 14-like [Salarias fasciatus]|uniref:tumor necrosis factor receptor superfamily member 14-like n=1 Tax=Salarias fasciatus TaxID=181472 RepID=UPI0011766834|nr:tumor necrosis factor receptor superfamily member 14-like [Salarias fasciatus]
MTPRRRPPAATVFLVMVLSVFSTDSLTCPPAKYEVDNECCPMCPAGTRVRIDCTAFRSTSCLPCEEGTFTEKPNGRSRCFSCTSCDPGSGLTVKKSCSGTSDTVCEPLEGFLCVDSSDRNSCAAVRKHRSCEPGQYIHQKGTASSDTQCSPCSDGTFSDGNSTTCQQHTQCEELGLLQTTAGTASADAQCEEENLSGTVKAVIVVLVVLLEILVIVGVVMFFKLKYNFKRNGRPEQETENFFLKTS